MRNKQYNDWLIPLAWPDTLVTAAPGFYDRMFRLFGVNRQGVYKAGHAAMLLVDGQSGAIEYYDFGRYITPSGMGRVRSQATDPELKFPWTAQISRGRIVNLEEILNGYQQSSSLTHGQGQMFASVANKVDGDGLRKWILSMQQEGGQPYGPFERKGTNCSRFVMDAILKHGQGRLRHLWGRFSLTPSPLGNVKKGAFDNVAYVVDDAQISTRKAFRMNLWIMVIGRLFHKIEGQPDKAIDVPKPTDSAVWLEGIGAGAWHELSQPDWLAPELYRFRRWSNNGLDLDVICFAGDSEFDFTQPFAIDFYSHAQKVRLRQGNHKFELDVVGEYHGQDEDVKSEKVPAR